MKSIFTFVLIGLAANVAAQDVDEGQKIYQTYCATCHGMDAKGSGPMAATLILQPTDLTQLSALNDGVFPTTRAAMRIDGRDPLVSHGSPMPVYGPYFEGADFTMKLETGQPMMTSRTLADVIVFLESIQAQ